MASDGTPGDGAVGPRGAAYNSCSVFLRGSGSSRAPGRTLAMAVFGLLGAEWCNASARAIATVCRSPLRGSVAFVLHGTTARVYSKRTGPNTGVVNLDC